jgi:flagellar hook-basal body complex protein FliE
MNIAPALKSASLPGIAAPMGVPGSDTGFADALGSAIGASINNVESSQQSAKSAAIDLLATGKGDVHSVALASQRAELTLELFQQVRNKFVQAYQEVMKMPM